MAEKKWGLVKSFDVDHGELDGVQRNECFVLGYELRWIDELVKLPAAIDRPVHALNRERIEKSCRDAEREFSLTWCGDSAEEWMRLVVYPVAAQQTNTD